MLPNCPYCLEVFGFIEELKKENPEYNDIKLAIIDERAEAELAARFDYYYVPTFYYGSVKLHEGAATKDKIAKVFEHYLES
jgi:thiol-disulfide isomerase/thioredoxin